MNVRSIVLFVVMAASLVATGYTVRSAPLHVIPRGVKVNGIDVGGMTFDRVEQELARRMKAQGQRSIKVSMGDTNFVVKPSQIGLKLDIAAVMEELRGLFGGRYSLWRRAALRRWALRGRYTTSTPVIYRRDEIHRLFSQMMKTVERPPRNARLDLINRKVIPSEDGRSMDLAGSIARFERIIQGGGDAMQVRMYRLKPRISSDALKDLSLKTVLGWYETSFASWGKWANRAHNLKVGGAKLTGTVLLPGKEFSINEALGPRTAKEGYRIAPVIALGETVDGMGGGMCQIASTMFAAAFFAGLDFAHAKPHSQPSHYIDLGLDATVFYPSVDLVLRNPYNFPVALRIDVSGGRVRVEVLGRERPFSKVTFIRRIVSETPFKTIFRDDKELFEGLFKKEQTGQKGYVVRRRRIFLDAEGHEIKAHTWTIVYAPTTMIIRKGTKKPDDPAFKAPPAPEFKPVGDPPAFRKESH